MGCSKRSYHSENIAVDALIEAKIRFEFNSASTVYKCDNCGEWHLTSTGEVHPKLVAAMDNGTLKREKQAMQYTKYR